MEIGNTGVVAILETGKEGSHIFCRFDIDALLVEESNDKTHFPFFEDFSSKYKGIMHACGHDGHTAIGLLLAHFISKNKEVLTGKFTLIFKPAEEGCRGSRSRIENGWIDNVDYFISSHIGIHDLALGEISATTTDFLATTKFVLSFK